MKTNYLLFVFCLASLPATAQEFMRSELPTTLSIPWEITYGADDFLWITESGGTVARVDPQTGEKTIVYVAGDYFDGSPLERLQTCFQPHIGKGTLGLALHPDFLQDGFAYIYYVYSYNSGSDEEPATKFRIKRLTWDRTSATVVADSNIVNMIPSGYDHLGGRLIAVEQDDVAHLFLSVGDNGVSEDNSPDCYDPQSENPNNFAQNPSYFNGKIHRFNMDGSIPADNPIAGNSFYTRGHRNPQGLMYNPTLDILYDVEHGDRTDDEINILQKGMNYGWKNVRGYHDGNFPEELDFVSNYTPHPDIDGDELIEPFYSWCDEVAPANPPPGGNWCTVAPSGGQYYGSEAIPEWTNSLLVVTLKDGDEVDREVYQFKLDDEGELVPSTSENPNPKRFFGEDQPFNGRLRDIAISADGKTIFLINNGGVSGDKIITYTALATSSEDLPESASLNDIRFYPNPNNGNLFIEIPQLENPAFVMIYDAFGRVLLEKTVSMGNNSLDLQSLPTGIVFIKIETAKSSVTKRVVLD